MEKPPRHQYQSLLHSNGDVETDMEIGAPSHNEHDELDDETNSMFGTSSKKKWTCWCGLLVLMAIFGLISAAMVFTKNQDIILDSDSSEGELEIDATAEEQQASTSLPFSVNTDELIMNQPDNVGPQQSKDNSSEYIDEQVQSESDSSENSYETAQSEANSSDNEVETEQAEVESSENNEQSEADPSENNEDASQAEAELSENINEAEQSEVANEENNVKTVQSEESSHNNKQTAEAEVSDSSESIDGGKQSEADSLESTDAQMILSERDPPENNVSPEIITEGTDRTEAESSESNDDQMQPEDNSEETVQSEDDSPEYNDEAVQTEAESSENNKEASQSEADSSENVSEADSSDKNDEQVHSEADLTENNDETVQSDFEPSENEEQEQSEADSSENNEEAVSSKLDSSEVKQLQISNYIAGKALILNIHITHHAGTSVCREMSILGPTPSFACMRAKGKETSANWPVDNDPNINSKNFTYEDAALLVDVFRPYFHFMSFEYRYWGNLHHANWEYNNLVSMIVMRNPLDRFLAEGKCGKGELHTLGDPDPESEESQQLYWEYANLPCADNYALRVLANTTFNEDNKEESFESAKALLKRFTFILDEDCLAESMVALGSELDLNITMDSFESRLHREHATARERIGNDTLYEFLLDKFHYDIELYEWSKEISIVKCSSQ